MRLPRRLQSPHYCPLPRPYQPGQQALRQPVRPRIQFQHSFTPRRPLVDRSGAPRHTITVARTLPYAPQPLYCLISDVDSYATYLPFVVQSTVTGRHPATRMPTTADLRVGFPPLDGRFNGAVVRCLEPGIVEVDAHDGSGGGGGGGNGGGGVLERLQTQWEIKPVAGHGAKTSTALGSVVGLSIHVVWKNQDLERLTYALLPRVVRALVDAFERKANVVFEGTGGEKDWEWGREREW